MVGVFLVLLTVIFPALNAHGVISDFTITLWGKYLCYALLALSVDLLGPAGLLAKGGPDAVDRGKWTRLYSFQRYSTIGGGSSEVQKNIIADRAIKLPGHSRLG